MADDFNGDGQLDLAVASIYSEVYPGGDNGQISVLLGNSDGTFQPAVQVRVGVCPKRDRGGRLQLADGRLDLAVAGFLLQLRHRNLSGRGLGALRQRRRDLPARGSGTRWGPYALTYILTMPSSRAILPATATSISP